MIAFSLLRCAAAAALVGSFAACSIAAPYRVVDAEARGPALVIVTEAILGDVPEARAAFWRNVAAVTRGLKGQPGLIGYGLRRELFGDRAWTMTVWRDADAAAGFVWTPSHQRAMSEGGAALTGMRVVRYRLPPGARPGWPGALARLAAEGSGYR